MSTSSPLKNSGFSIGCHGSSGKAPGSPHSWTLFGGSGERARRFVGSERGSAVFQRAARLFLLALLASACAAPVVSVPPKAPAPATPPIWDASQARSAVSSDGSYRVTYRALPNEVPVNAEFDVEFYITRADEHTKLLDPDLVVIDARMPGHGHGMLYEVSLERTPDGVHVARGMLFHMTGHWELYVDITVGAWTERAQFDIELE